MKKHILTFGLCFLGLTTLAQPPAHRGRGANRPDSTKRAEMATKWAEDLKLSDKQKSEMEKLKKAHLADTEALRAEIKTKTDLLRTKRDAHRKAMMALLTEDQKTELLLKRGNRGHRKGVHRGE